MGEVMNEETMRMGVENTETKARDIGGLLILVAIGVVMSPLRILYFLSTVYPSIFTDGTWEALANEASPTYLPLWGPLIIGEIIVNAVVLLASLYLAFLFFNKKSEFVYWYAGIALFSLAFILADAYMVTLIIPEIPMFDKETTSEVLKALVSCLVWMPYLIFSKRSKETFVR
jgi:ABC-type multidrug transport system permease subunit